MDSLRSSLPRLALVIAGHAAVLATWPAGPAPQPVTPEVFTARWLSDSPAPSKADSPPPAPQPARPKPAKPIQQQPLLTTTSPASSSVASAPPAPVTPPASPAASTTNNAAGQPSASISQARFDAGYLHNPKPVYPSASRRGGEEGKVLLRVMVSADGSAQVVDVISGSGFSRLDQAALDAVRRWKFVPAKRGETPVDGVVRVPINFSLEDA